MIEINTAAMGVFVIEDLSAAFGALGIGIDEAGRDIAPDTMLAEKAPGRIEVGRDQCCGRSITIRCPAAVAPALRVQPR